ncbi:family 20 glycosylhydrolase [Chitinophagaceae bacterium LB-8]|uniref:Family 20 glycosylhydrolase n=1 Tax=Paraflavisolibacter caeni TaxID=2982496 RepID=A0A9X2XZC1_9BACT|nr:family 20 glycosylhydrolase [Paraflavisolibacter caeni]MCU7552206.1 family 20 glycosylhydrolase [Paraflavisolibacter caeni]
MNMIFKHGHALLIAVCFTSATLSAVAQKTENPQPFVIPALREWQGDTGTFIMHDKTVLVVDPAYRNELTPVANTFLDDLKKSGAAKQVSIRTGTPAKEDIYFTLNPADTAKGKESYVLTIKDFITIAAPKSIGAFWATRSLLQILEQDKEFRRIPKGVAVDYPQFAVRGFVLDCGRKFFSLSFLRNYVKFMSYYKMNDFHIHLNDNGFKGFFGDNWDSTYAAFRLQNDTYPNLTAKDGSYSKKEFIELQKLADQYGVNIIPEIDVPAHSLAFAKAVPGVGSKVYGLDHLDLDNPLTYEVIDNVFKEYLEGPNPVFRGKEVHIGTDEYSKKEAEKFRSFTDHYIRLVESYGKKARLWGALTHAPGTTPVKSENVTMNLWYNGYADPKEMMKLGYDGISTPDGWLYIVPAAGYYYDYLNTKRLYNQWTPNMIGKDSFPENSAQIRGGSFAVWNDHVGNGITEKDVHHRVFPAMQVLAQKMWGGTKTTLSYEAFLDKNKNIGEGPGLNMMGKVRSKDSLVLQYSFNQNKQDPSGSGNAILANKNAKIDRQKQALRLNGGNSYIQTPIEGIGYGYTISFSMNPDKNNKPDAVLFSSPDAIVKLKQQSTGKLGFSREGYHYNFNYSVPVDQWTHIVITGDNKGTSLYVNGVLVEKLEGAKRTFPNGKQTAKVQTLFFPLQYIGDKTNAFKGYLDNLNVFNTVLPADKIKELAK